MFAFGFSTLIWQHLLNFQLHWVATEFPLIALLAVGSDYNLMLVSRIEEEIGAGLKTGLIRGMGVTGPVVIAAGVVFAVTMGTMITSICERSANSARRSASACCSTPSSSDRSSRRRSDGHWEACRDSLPAGRCREVAGRQPHRVVTGVNCDVPTFSPVTKIDATARKELQWQRLRRTGPSAATSCGKSDIALPTAAPPVAPDMRQTATQGNSRLASKCPRCPVRTSASCRHETPPKTDGNESTH